MHDACDSASCAPGPWPLQPQCRSKSLDSDALAPRPKATSAAALTLLSPIYIYSYSWARDASFTRANSDVRDCIRTPHPWDATRGFVPPRSAPHDAGIARFMATPSLYCHCLHPCVGVPTNDAQRAACAWRWKSAEATRQSMANRY